MININQLNLYSSLHKVIVGFSKLENLKRFLAISPMMKVVSICNIVIPILLVSLPANAQQMYTDSNAASIENESNSVSGWTGGSEESTSSTEVYSGNYSLKFRALGSGYYYTAYTFNTVPDEQYLISLYGKNASTSNPGIHWNNVIENQVIPITSTSWTNYSKTVTATGSTIRILVYSGAPAVIDDMVFIDNVSITPVESNDTQPPTSPTLSEMTHSETTVDLSWSGATDNEGVTGYKVYKDGVLHVSLGNQTLYQAKSLSPGTTYDFKVSAIDGQGNESSRSNVVSVTTDSSSGGGGGTTDPIWSESNGVASYAGNVAIGATTVPNGYTLAVDGKIIGEEVKVQLSGNWPDYVFKEDYKLPTLEEIKKHIDEKGHLPNIPSAEEVKINGVEVGEMNRLLLEKVEELTLYILLLEEILNKQNIINSDLLERIEKLELISRAINK